LLVVPDVRDTVNYKEVMKQYGLGPNGAIVTSLNLFATKFDKVISLLEKASSTHELAVIDTPGQIEVFTWSASGNIVTEALASTFPTVVVYVMDTIRSVNPVTFMSNMLYACSILYKTKLPFIVAMNKVGLGLLWYTGCPRRNVQNFGSVFLMLNYTDITQNTYIQS